MSKYYDLINGDWLDQYMADLERMNPAQINIPEPAQIPVNIQEPAQVPVNIQEPAQVPVNIQEPAQIQVNVPEPPQIPNPLDAEILIDNDCYRDRFCPCCMIHFSRPGELDRHLYQVHPEYYTFIQHGGGDPGPQVTFSEAQSALNRLYVKYIANLENLPPFNDVDELFASARAAATIILQNELHQRRNIRAIFSILAVFSRTDPVSGEVEYTSGERMQAMTSFAHILMDPSMISRILESAANKLAVEVEDFLQNGSGWVLDHVHEFVIKIGTYNAIRGSSYIDLPPLLQRKKSTLLNIENIEQNKDEDHLKCFVWSILAHPSVAGIPDGCDHRYLRSTYAKKVATYKPHINKLNLDGLKFPMTVDQIEKFEKLNPRIGITVIAYEMKSEEGADYSANLSYNEMQEEIRDRCFPRYVCKENRPIKIDLLLLIPDIIECDQRPDHFVLIRSLTSLLYTPRDKNKKAICRMCLQSFGEEWLMEDHQKYCSALRLQKTTFPTKENNILKFKNWNRTQPIPYRIYADFESVLEKMELVNGKTIRTQKHIPCGYSWICVDWNGNRKMSNYYHAHEEGEDIGKRFLKEIITLCNILKKEMVHMQNEAAKTMQGAQNLPPSPPPRTKCYFCREKFGSSRDKYPVRHHSHLPDYQFIGWAHNACNLNARMGSFISVIMHSFGSYDCHFIVQACDKTIVDTFEIIAKTSEKFLTILVNGFIRFLDSYAFFNQPLSKLAESLPKTDESFKILRQEFGHFCGDVDLRILGPQFIKPGNVELLLQKQAYPYSYIDSVKRFQEEKLPPIEAFYNDLADKPLDPEVYVHLHQVWQSFQLNSLGAFHDLYVRSDSAILACIFEANRRTMLKHYDLDIAQYFSLPMVAKDALLKKTGAQIELITDSTMFCWLEDGIRGGMVSVGSLRLAEANNPYMGTEYDSSKRTSFITFQDANNLYGWSLSQPLPVGDFEFVEGVEFMRLAAVDTIMSLGIGDLKGYIYEVDLEIPTELHDYLNDYPPAPIRREIHRDELSIHQKNLIDEKHIPNSVLKTKRLIADLLPKLNMKCHYRNLQMWLKLGCKLKAVHKILRFTQRCWMKSYIDFNTYMRQLATSDIEIAFWKALNNLGFGKMIEKLRERLNVIPIMTETKGKKYNKKPTIRDIKIIHEGLVLLMMNKLAVKLNNPLAVGMTCLELSKLVMYNFHYFYMKPKYGSNARLCYTDTDSFVYYIEYPLGGDMYRDFKIDERAWFDMSEYSEQDATWRVFYSPLNKKVLGKMKDEMSNCVITHIIAPKPKMYIVRYLKDGVDKLSGCVSRDVLYKKKAKGLAIRTVQSCLTQENYANALMGKDNPDLTMRTIRSYNHVLYTTTLKKKSVSGLDVKRHCLADNISTLAFGHKDIQY